MNLDIPIYKTFIFENKYYYYDTNKNSLLEINKELFNELKIISKTGLNKYLNEKEKDNTYNTILNLSKKGFFSSNIISKIEHVDTKNVEVLCDRAVHQLILGITNLCNFKCRYCHQAEGKLLSTQNMMSIDVAYQSIDFLYDHSKDSEEITITFYGGEPLLNFDLIKKCVEYANNKFISKKVKYNTTTNASLLNDEIIDFLYKNDFSLLISLDGNRNTQNRHRKFLSNGEGTFDVVFQNILKMKEKYPIYFDEQVGFNAVLLDDDNPDETIQFFIDNNLFSGNISIKRADMTGIDYTISPILYKDNFKNDYLDKIQFDDNIKVYNNKCHINNIWHHNGPCIPGLRRLFVNAEGDFFPCEKVNSDESLNIGSIYQGFNYDNVRKLMNIGSITESECKKCWALRFCSICPFHCADNGRLSREKKLLNCDIQKKRTIDFFKQLIIKSKKD